MDLLETEYQNPDQLDMLRTYEPIMRHLVRSLSTVMSMSPEESLNHMLMSCVQHRLGIMHNAPPPGSTSTQLVHYGEPDNQKLADMIRLSMVAFSSQNQCSVTPEGLKAALLGPDPLGLGGDQPMPIFMLKRFVQIKAQPEEEVEIPRPKSTCLSCAARGILASLPTPVAVTVRVHQAPVAPPVHEEREQAAHTPVVTRSRAGTPSV